MDFNKFNWDKSDREKYIEYLISYKDYEYKEFQEGIVNTKLNIIGVRMQYLKEIANDIGKSNNVLNYLEYIDKEYYESVLIYGLVLSKCSDDIINKYIMKFLELIDNWAICDSFCSSMKCVRNKLGKWWIYLVNLIDLDKEFQTRFSMVMFMDYYLCDNYIDRVLKIVCSIKSDYYYINMAISWLLSVAIIDYKDKVINILESNVLSKFVQNKTISKIQDSYRVDNNTKEFVKKFRIST